MDKNLNPTFSGLIIAHCPSCGEYTVFFSKEVVNRFRCSKCTKPTYFKGEPVQLVSKCECGNKIRAVTNSSEPIFQFNCKCGYPNSVEYSKSKNKYFGII